MIGLTQHKTDILRNILFQYKCFFEIGLGFEFIIRKKITYANLIIELSILGIVLIGKQVLLPGITICPFTLLKKLVSLFNALPRFTQSLVTLLFEVYLLNLYILLRKCTNGKRD